MLDGFNPNRYSVIEEKNKREIVMLIGSGCKWGRCKFCDYHLDCDTSEDVCYKLNKSVLENVTGVYSKLEVINSGSFTELDKKTVDLIEQICVEKNIKELHFECHYLYRHAIGDMRKRFAKNNIVLKIKCGVEDIAKYFDEVCLLQGLDGQNEKSMLSDIQIGLKYFERVCINIMQENGCEVKPNYEVIKIFEQEIYPKIKDDIRLDILMENTAFGVGGVTT